jgi:hypothetical protein
MTAAAATPAVADGHTAVVSAMADDDNAAGLAAGGTWNDDNYNGGDNGINDVYDIDMRAPGSHDNGGGGGRRDLLVLGGHDDDGYGGGGPGRDGGRARAAERRAVLSTRPSARTTKKSNWDPRSLRSS